MKTVLAIALALAALVPSTAARADGCPLPCSGQSASPANAKYVYVQPTGSHGQVHAYDTRTRRRAFTLPAGLTSADGRWHVTALAFRGRTSIARFLVAVGRPQQAFSIRGGWKLGGVSPSGRWLALTRRSGRETHIATVDSGRPRLLQIERLVGNFEVETISGDGERLFLIQHVGEPKPQRYVVRLYDVRQQRLRAAALRDPTVKGLMTGYAWSGIASPNGRWLLTLYLDTRRQHAFIHSLDLVRSRPVCINLPSGRGVFERLKQYSLTLSPDGRTVYAANAALGVLAEIDLAKQRVVRTARFRARPSPARRSGATTSGAISRDGRTLYFSGGRDLWAYDAAFGLVRGPYRTRGELAGFGYGRGDKRLYAVRPDGRVLAFAAATGRAARA